MHPPLHRSIALSLALCAMLLRGLLPMGWMPNPAAEAGGSPFVICSVDGVHSGGKAPADQGQERAHAPCAFAAAAHLAPPAFGPAVASLPSYAGEISAEQSGAIFAAVLLHRPQAARAPPAFS